MTKITIEEDGEVISIESPCADIYERADVVRRMLLAMAYSPKLIDSIFSEDTVDRCCQDEE